MGYKNLTVQKKIATVFSVIGIAMISFAFFLLQELEKVESEVINFTDSTVPSVLSAEALYFEMNAYRRNQYASLNYETKDALDFLTRLSKQENDINAELAEYETTIISDYERRIFDQVKNTWQIYLTQLKGFNALVSNQDIKQAQKELMSSFQLFDTVGIALDGLVQINLGFVANNRTAIMHSVDSVKVATKISFSILILFMCLMTFLLARQICRPLHLVVEQSKAIASGDLTGTLPREKIGNDELGVLADANIAMQHQLRTLIENAILAVTQLSNEVNKGLSKELPPTVEAPPPYSSSMVEIINEITTVIDEPKQASSTLKKITATLDTIPMRTHAFVAYLVNNVMDIENKDNRLEEMAIMKSYAFANEIQSSINEVNSQLQLWQGHPVYDGDKESKIKLYQLASTLQSCLSYFKVR